MPSAPHNFARIRRRRGFTLIEAALVTVICGVGTVAVLQLMAAGTVSSRAAYDQTTGMNLVKNIREMTWAMSFCDALNPTHFGRESGETSLPYYDDLDDLNGLTFSPPIDARRKVLTDMQGWEQSIQCHSVSPDWLTLEVPNGSTRALRMTVTVRHHGKVVCTQSWVAFDTSP